MPTFLHLIPTLGGGGAERQLAYLAAALQRLGANAHVGFLQGGPNLDRLLADGVTTHCLGPLGNYDVRLVSRISKLIHQVRPDLIQTWLTQMDILGGVASLWHGIPYVLSERASALAYPNTWKYWLRLYIGRRAAGIVANSKAGGDYWTARAPRTRIAVIRNGIPGDLIRTAFPANPGILGLPADARLILCAGRLSPEKNLDILVQALDEVLVARPDCVALLFGDGELQSSIQSHLGIARARDRMRLLGYTNELWRWMRRASAFVSISRFEGNPNTVLEAMAVGCPLVVSRIPQHKEILDDSTASFCDPNSVADVAAAINKALSDPAATDARAEAARCRSAKWSVEEAARQYFRLYTTLAIRQTA